MVSDFFSSERVPHSSTAYKRPSPRGRQLLLINCWSTQVFIVAEGTLWWTCADLVLQWSITMTIGLLVGAQFLTQNVVCISLSCSVVTNH